MNEVLKKIKNLSDTEKYQLIQHLDKENAELKTQSGRAIGYASPASSGVQNGGRFIDGLLYAIQFLVIQSDQPTIASNILRESNYTKTELLQAQKECGYENKKMNKIINEL